ncbi:polysaccharide deacetylase family protein [Legionella anisa]|nr:polysaccharide deacetylase family protein [Legionella anisa]KTC68542.1 polysaccharide deacetylase [Legionella anisa]MBN5935309.1 polysaccharide deacetylase family protein [Legionella anisa]MCW8426429.1 polysaccharide deacetylase family protein [Legionella anisa]MCW8448090.1 polysaccharide deacetylase family protein [Legionella anisa]UAK78716.1 polysaccharide deacetylase family protein [Legionella anisa]
MTNKARSFWPNKARLAISISMQFEAGGEPAYGFDSPFSGAPLPPEYPDLPAKTWFQYGYQEGIPRLLELWDKYDIKVTSHMVGQAVLANPELAKKIVKRGHEAAAHGMSWSSQFNMSREQEKEFIAAGVKAIHDVTGVTPRGYNCNWLRRSINTISVLQELGFLYHIDDLSRDEPFVLSVNGKPFAVVPYTIRCNDIVLIEGRHFSPDAFLSTLKHEFDQLYAESEFRRRQMSISTHDRIGGTPAVVRVLEQFLEYAHTHPNVWFARKDEIANWILENHSSRS